MADELINSKLWERFGKIKLLLLDVDGVLTDGRIIYDSRGRDSKFFDVSDGLGVFVLHKSGIKTILITAKSSKTIKAATSNSLSWATITPDLSLMTALRSNLSAILTAKTGSGRFL